MTESLARRVRHPPTSPHAAVPLLHFTPPAGWMNDPNGLIEWNGRHHLFFQHDPDDISQKRIRWGHASSPDLIRWTNHPDVLLPGVPDTAYDQDGCYSGCAVAGTDDVTLLYTGVEGTMQLPCLATSVTPDLAQFAKASANPIIANRPLPDVVAFRDHSVFRDGGIWRQAVGGGTARLGGAVFGYTGRTLADWTFDQIILDSTRSTIPGPIWECPDLFRGPEGDVLIVSPLDETKTFVSATPAVWYTTGHLVDGRFEPRYAELLDYGDRLYAPQSYWTSTGRRLMFGWIRTDQDAAVNTRKTRGAMTLPRELVLRGSYLYQHPAQELLATRSQSPIATLNLSSAHPAADIDPPLAAAEIVISGGSPAIESIELISADQRRLQVRVDSIPAGPQMPDQPSTIVYFDAGIVETFRDGRAAVTTDLALDRLARVVVHRSPRCRAESIIIWALTAG